MQYPTIDSDNPNEILCQAAKIIEDFGWTRGVYGNNDGAVCAVGALRAAITGNFSLGLYSQKLAERINAAYDTLQTRIGGSISIVAWNDQRVRTKEEVLAVLKEGGC